MYNKKEKEKIHCPVLIRIILHLAWKEIPMSDSKSRVYLPFQEKLSYFRTDPHKWCHCYQISLLHEITFWSADGSKTEHFYSREL